MAQELTYEFDFRFARTKGSIEVEELPTIEADRAQMTQLFRFLMLAILAHRTENGPVQVRLSGSRAQDMAEIRVLADGAVFSSNQQDAYFKPRYQWQSVLNANGTGMELAVCRKIVERHGGDIAVDSKEAGTTEFIIHLPVGSVRNNLYVLPGRKKIVIAIAGGPESEFTPLKEALAKSRWRVQFRHEPDSRSVLDFLRGTGFGSPSARPNLLILNLHMEDKSGCELLEEIRSIPRLKSVPVVMLADSWDDHALIRCYDLGVSSFVAKPSDPKVLAKVLERIVSLVVE